MCATETSFIALILFVKNHLIHVQLKSNTDLKRNHRGITVCVRFLSIRKKTNKINDKRLHGIDDGKVRIFFLPQNVASVCHLT